MPESSEPRIGMRLRTIRKRRGLTQQELAGAAGFSVSFISKLEQRQITEVRMETVRRLAVALRVPTTSLHSGDEGVGETKPDTNMWKSLQQAVESPAVQPDEPPTVDGVRRALAEVRTAHTEKRMSDEVTLLVPLLRDADALGDELEARALRSHLLHMAGSTLTQSRQFAAAETALRRALDDATDRLRAAAVVTTQVWLLMRQGRFDDARQLAQRWADDVEPRLSRATTDDLAAWGWLLLHGSAASLRDNRSGEADDMMRLARAAAVVTGGMPSGPRRLNPWSPLVVAYKAQERSIILDRPDEVLAVADRLHRTGAGHATDYHRHRLDVAKAHSMVRQYGQAVEVLAEVRDESPEWLAQQRYARDIMIEVIGRRRTLTPQMRALADLTGVPL